MGTKEPNAAPEWSGIPLNSEMTGTLEGPGDMTSFPVDVPEAGMSTVETNGAPHTVGHFGAGERPALYQSGTTHETLSFWSVRPVREGVFCGIGRHE